MRRETDSESPRPAGDRAAREARLKAALRENLRRRKAQARGRVRESGPMEVSETPPRRDE